jgi:hypothetical protein
MGGVARPEVGDSGGPFMELDRERGPDLDRNEFARERGWSPELGDGEGGIRTELDTGY